MTIWRDEAREQAKRLFAEVFGYPCPWCGQRFASRGGIRQHRMKTRRCRIYRKSKVRRATDPKPR